MFIVLVMDPRRRTPFWLLFTFAAVFLVWHKARLGAPTQTHIVSTHSDGSAGHDILFSTGGVRQNLDIRGATLFFHILRINNPSLKPNQLPNLRSQVVLYLAMALLSDAWDIELNPGPYKYKGKYPCQICSKACKWKQQVIRCDSCNTWWHKECMGMSDSVFDDYVDDQALTWECRNCLAVNISTTLFDSVIVNIPPDTENTQNGSPQNATSDTPNTALSSSLQNSFTQIAPQSQTHANELDTLSPGSPSVPLIPLAESSPAATTADQLARNLYPNPLSPAELTAHSTHVGSSGMSAHSTSVANQLSASRVDRSDNPLRLVLVNCRSIKSKQERLQNIVHCTKPDIILGTESWLHPEISDNEAFSPEITEKFEVHRNDRRGKFDKSEGGGVFVLVSRKFQSWTCERLDKFTKDAEMIWCNIKMDAGKPPAYIGCFYRPEHTDTEYLDHLNEALTILNTEHDNSPIWLGGDFNLPDIDWDEGVFRPNGRYAGCSRKMIDIATEHGLSQSVKDPTRTVGDTGNVLDLLFTNRPAQVNRVETMPSAEMSDHDPVYAEISANALVTTKPPRQVPQYNRVKWEDFKRAGREVGRAVLEASDAGQNVTSLWNILRDGIKDAIKQHIPTKTLKDRKGLPWVTTALKRLMRKRDKARQKWRKSKGPSGSELHIKFQKLKKQTQSAMRRAYWTYIESIITDTDEYPQPGITSKVSKKFWGFIRRLKRDNSGIAPLKEDSVLHSNSAKKAEILNNQYQSQFTQEDLSSVPKFETQSPHPSIARLTIGVEGVQKLLQGVDPHKAQGPDELPARVLHELAADIAPALARIFQVSYDEGVAPQEWRQANVAPIYKGKNSTKSDPANYRPISLTSICSKLFEHILVKNILIHLNEQGILTDAQHGFRARRSCETQLVTLVQDLANSMAGGGQTDVILLDFSKAFDKVPHQRLLYKLHNYGIRGNHLKWIEGFLTQRHQRVIVEGEASPYARVESGVPQGTVLGPLLFLLFINDLPSVVNHSHVRLFADDAAIYRQIRTVSDAKLLQRDLDNLARWEHQWQMAFHPGKCKVMRMSRATSKIEQPYRLRGHELDCVHQEKYLGVVLDDRLSWGPQISSVTGNAKRKLGFLRRNLKVSCQPTKTAAYRSLCRSTLEYCCSAWDPHQVGHIDDLNMVQRQAARYVCNQYGQDTHPTIMMETLGWESLEDRRKKVRLSLTHKIVHNHIDIPLERYYRPSTRTTRGSSHSHGLLEPRTNCDYLAATFFYDSPKYWNNLLPKLAEAPTPEAFKEGLKKLKIQSLLDPLPLRGQQAP